MQIDHQQLIGLRENQLSPYWSSAYEIPDFISSAEVKRLLEIRASRAITREKTYSDEVDLQMEGEIRDILAEKVEQAIPDGLFTNFYFFRIFKPFWPHTDTGYDADVPIHKVLHIPLAVEPEKESHIIFFKQRHLGHAATFAKGCDVSLYSNACIQKYDDIHNLKSESGVSAEDYRRYIDHIPPSVLEGLEIDNVFKVKPGTAIVFDRCQLHCSCNYFRRGIDHKIGINLFTEVKDMKMKGL